MPDYQDTMRDYRVHTEPDYLDTRETSALTTVPVETLEWWRKRGDRGPRWFRMGERLIRYDRADVLRWIEDQKAASPVQQVSA